MRLVALGGGTGAAKLLRGLARLLSPDELTIIVNTGDDAVIWGLHVSPDLDTVCYALGGLLDERRGWGLRGETFRALDHIARFGEPTWFNLGDGDLATHLYRTRRLRSGDSLTEVTQAIAAALGVPASVLPMSDQPVRTRIRGPAGWLAFQEYFVRERAEPEVSGVAFDGADAATPAPGAVEAIHGASAVIVCPSNPVTSIGPILAVPGMVQALCETAAVTIAVSPIVGGAPVSGPAGRLMAAMGLPVSIDGVARAYASWLDVLVVDERDRAGVDALAATGVTGVVAATVMTDHDAETALARRVLEIAA